MVDQTALVGIGIAPHQVRARNEATPMATAGERRGRNSTCVNRLSVALLTVQADIPGADTAVQVMADRAVRRAIPGRVTVAVVRDRCLATEEVEEVTPRALEAVEDIPAVEVAAIPVEEVEVIPEVVGTADIARTRLAS